MLYFDLSFFIQLTIGFISISFVLFFILIMSFINYNVVNERLNVELVDHVGDFFIINSYYLDKDHYHTYLELGLIHKILAIIWSSVGFILIILIIYGFYELYKIDKYFNNN